jgi:hypothetical protein
VSASKKLQREDAEAIAGSSDRMIVMKGKKISSFDVGASTSEEAVTAMLGATGNMRAPLLRIGSLVLVGFNEDVYSERLG